MRKEDPKFIEKRKKFYAEQKQKSKDKYSKGGLSPKQKVIAAKAPPPDKITGEDFAVMKKEKAGKVKPIKAVLGIAAMGLMGAKMLKDKNKKAMALPGVGAAALMAKKKKEILGKRMGGVMKAKRGMLSNRSLPTIKTAPGSIASKAEKKQGKKKLREFLPRRLKLVGSILGAAGAGAVGQKLIDKIKKKKKKKELEGDVKGSISPYLKKKMGGGMMQKYSKGGGSDASKYKNKKMPKAIAQGKTKKVIIYDMMPADTAMRTGSPMPRYSKGGRMMQKPMGYDDGGSTYEKPILRLKPRVRNARGQNPNRPRGPARPSASGPKKSEDFANNSKFKKFNVSGSDLTIVLKDTGKKLSGLTPLGGAASAYKKYKDYQDDKKSRNPNPKTPKMYGGGMIKRVSGGPAKKSKPSPKPEPSPKPDAPQKKIKISSAITGMLDTFKDKNTPMKRDRFFSGLTGKMGGGMMNKPMGYKSGKSIKVKCKLGKNKPTKMY